MIVHKKELNEKQIEFEGVVGSLKKKNAHLSEQRRCLLLGKGLKQKPIIISKDTICRNIPTEIYDCLTTFLNI